MTDDDQVGPLVLGDVADGTQRVATHLTGPHPQAGVVAAQPVGRVRVLRDALRVEDLSASMRGLEPQHDQLGVVGGRQLGGHVQGGAGVVARAGSDKDLLDHDKRVPIGLGLARRARWGRPATHIEMVQTLLTS